MIAIAAAIAGVMAMVITAAATPLTRLIARRVDMLDRPIGHRQHGRTVPLLGGSAVLLGVGLPTLAAILFTSVWTARGAPAWLPDELTIHLPGAAAKANQALGILTGALALHILGIVDDCRPLGAAPKFAVQFAVAIFVALFCEVRVLVLAGPALSIPLTVLWIVAITNAFNFLDNTDGLSVGVAAICCAALLATATQTGQVFVTIWLCIILGALVGFWPYNFPSASTFMGDAGSLVVGYVLAVATCLTTYVQPGRIGVAAGVFVPIVLMAVPIYDMLSVIFLRLRRGLNPLAGDRRHFSHRLVQRGLSPTAAVLTIYLCTAGTAIAAFLLLHTDEVGACLVGVQTVLILMIIALLEWGGQADTEPEVPSRQQPPFQP